MRQILLFAALAAVLALLLVSCGGTKDKPVPTEEDAPGKAAYHKISAEEAYEMMISQEIVVVDVRTREEYDGGHIENAILTVQTQFKVMVDDGQLEPDGLQPLSIRLAFRVDLHLVDQNFHQSAAFRLGHGGIKLVKANQDLIDVVACDFVGFNGLLLCPGIHQSIFHLFDFIVHLIKAVVKVRFSGDKVPVVRGKAVDLLHKPGFCGVVLP